MKLKTASFTIRATVVQSARWKQAAAAEGHASVGTWAAEALDAHLEARTRAGKPLPLAWSHGVFRVRLEDGREPEVRGWIARPFGFFHGTPPARSPTARRTTTPWSISVIGGSSGRSTPPATARASLPSWRASGCVGEGVSPPKIPQCFFSGSNGRTYRNGVGPNSPAPTSQTAEEEVVVAAKD